MKNTLHSELVRSRRDTVPIVVATPAKFKRVVDGLLSEVFGPEDHCKNGWIGDQVQTMEEVEY